MQIILGSVALALIIILTSVLSCVAINNQFSRAEEQKEFEEFLNKYNKENRK